MITADQVKAARKLLRWDQRQVALKAGMSETAVHRFEDGEDPSLDYLRIAIRRAFEHAGLEFPDGEPVRLKAK